MSLLFSVFVFAELSPEPVDVLFRHQILDDDKAIFLIGESLFWGQQVGIESVSSQKNKK